MEMIAQDRADELQELLDNHGIKIRFKSDGYEAWWHTAASCFMIALFFVMRVLSFGAFKKKWSDFTTVFDGHVYLGAFFDHMKGDLDLKDYNLHRVLRHELVHQLQMLNHGKLWYTVSYLVPPAFITIRAQREMEAYLQQMIVDQEVFGLIPQGTLDWVEDQFSSPSYLFMDVRRRRVRRQLEEYADGIHKRNITGLHPYLPDVLDGADGRRRLSEGVS